MKKWLLMTAALLALTSKVAIADGMNLAWGTCRTSVNNGSFSVNEFSPMPCDDPVVWTVRQIVSSFRNTTPLTGFTGTTIVIDLFVSGTSIPDFWNIAPGGCADVMVSGRDVLGGVGNCTNPYSLPPADPQGQTNLVDIQLSPTYFNSIRITANHLRNSLAVDLPVPTSPGGYLANSLTLENPVDYDRLCSGCETPACFALQRLDYYSSTETRSITAPDLWNVIKWYGGTLFCNWVVPTRTSTWGEVKALYR